jgi:hypothetical protein
MSANDAAPVANKAQRWAVALFLVSLAANVALAAVGWNNTVLDFIAFRQAQTALNTHFMLGHRYAVVYETPVLGPPWAIPYEFPLYEWFVAGLATVTGWPVDPCGRLVSKVFFLLTLVPTYHILRRLGVAAPARFVVLSLFLVSPFFIFWSRTFLIESTALFFSAAFLDAVLAFGDRPGVGFWLVALVCGTLAGLVKITTLAGFVLLALLVPLQLFRAYRKGLLDRRSYRRRLAALLLLLAVPAASGVAWTAFTDSVKEQNFFGRTLTSKALRNWNYGTWDQRFSPATWGTMLERSGLAVAHPGSLFRGGGVVGVFVLAAACIWAARRTRRWQVPIAACFVAYVALPLVFTNLYWFHEYYHVANHPFLLGAIGLALAALLAAGGRLRKAALAFVACSVVLAGVVYASYYYPIQSSNVCESAGACRAVRESTVPDDVILVLGVDWSSEIGYYSQRRSLSLPDSWGHVHLERLAEYLEPLRTYHLAALVVRQPDDYRSSFPAIDRALAGLGLRRASIYSDSVFEVYYLEPQTGGN